MNNICAHTFFQISRWWCGWHIIMITGFLTFWGSCSFIFCLSRRRQKISDSLLTKICSLPLYFLMIWRIKQRCLMYVNFLFQLVSSFCLRKTSKLDHRKLETIFDSIGKHDNQRLRYCYCYFVTCLEEAFFLNIVRIFLLFANIVYFQPDITLP